MKQQSEHQLQTWSVIIPCYNEEGSIKNTIQRVEEVLPGIASEYEIIVIDDGSEDRSVKIVKELQQEDTAIRLICFDTNNGLGKVLRTGYFEARYENVVSIPGDGQFDPQELAPVSPVQENTLISFYRQENLTYSFYRNYLSYLHKWLNKWLIGLSLKDVNWVIVFKRKDFERLNLKLHSTLIKSEICAKLFALGYKSIEVPSVYHPREHGTSKGSSSKIVYQAARDTLKLMYVVNLFRLSKSKRH